MKYLAYLFALTLLFPTRLWGQSPPSPEPFLEIMDPETVYSFRGIDGQGFLLRSPVNLPQPFYTGEETGIVALRFVITPGGQVARATLENDLYSTANNAMVAAAREAVLRWKFAPLPAPAAQSEEEVRVVIQFNQPNSGVRYAVDGCVTITGLDDRHPIKLTAPVYTTPHEGIVTALLTLAPEGHVAWVDAFYGARPEEPVVPRLGIITHAALRAWRFAARPYPEMEAHAPSRGEDPDDEADPYQQIKVVFRYQRWE